MIWYCGGMLQAYSIRTQKMCTRIFRILDKNNLPDMSNPTDQSDLPDQSD